MGAPERQPVWIPGAICCGLHFLSAINVGTSKRTPATPWGNCALPHVQAFWPAI